MNRRAEFQRAPGSQDRPTTAGYLICNLSAGDRHQHGNALSPRSRSHRDQPAEVAIEEHLKVLVLPDDERLEVRSAMLNGTLSAATRGSNPAAGPVGRGATAYAENSWKRPTPVGSVSDIT